MKDELSWGIRRVKLLGLPKKRIYTKWLLSFFILMTILSISSIVAGFPNEITMIKGEKQKFLNNIIFNIDLEQNQKSIEVKSASLLSPYTFLNAQTTGTIKGEIKLFGFFPIKKLTVNILPDLMVVPSGESIGVKIKSKGIMIVGLSSITGLSGKKTCPAAESGFIVGDKIIEINNQAMEKENDIVEIINSDINRGKRCRVLIERDKKVMELTISPVQSVEDKLYKLGLWVRGSISGVGTLTFYEPLSGRFAALGHGITDVESGLLIDIDNGKILKSKVISIQKAKKSSPGEIIGIFNESNGIYGIIEKNTPYGIYGYIDPGKVNRNVKTMPIGLGSHVKEGNAKILTTIEDNKVEEFDIEIQKVFKQNNADSKGMIIKITDNKLIEKTGGIVQGMSGSPIIHNGRLVGSITHVLVNDPMRGYGIFVEWMFNETKDDKTAEYRSVSGQ